MVKEQIVYKNINELKHNPNNPRRNDGAVNTIALSIQKYGFRNPLIIDADNVVYCGNTRLKAAKQLGIKEVPCIVADDLTEQQIREYALLDNKTNEIAEWDEDLLQEELDVLDLGEFELDWGVEDFVTENEKIKQPKYELTITFDSELDLINLKENIQDYKYKNIRVKIEE